MYAGAVWCHWWSLAKCLRVTLHDRRSTYYGPCTAAINTHIILHVYCIKAEKGKGRYSSSWEPHLRATGRHLPYGSGSHSVTCHPTRVNAPRLTPAMQAGTRFSYPGRMEGWVDLVDLIAPRPGVEPATFRSRVRRRTAAPPRQRYRRGYSW